MKTRTLCTVVLFLGAAIAAQAQPAPPPNAPPGGPGGFQRGPGPNMQGLGALSPEEREKLKNAFAQARQDPAVKAAREKLRGADRRAAFEEMKKAMREAMLKADPSLAETLKKIGPGMTGRGFAARRGFANRGFGGPQWGQMPPNMGQQGGGPAFGQGRQRLRQNYGAFSNQRGGPQRGWNQPPPQGPAINPQAPGAPPPPAVQGPMSAPNCPRGWCAPGFQGRGRGWAPQQRGGGPNGPQGMQAPRPPGIGPQGPQNRQGPPAGPQGGGFRRGWQPSGPGPQAPAMGPWDGRRWQ